MVLVDISQFDQQRFYLLEGKIKANKKRLFSVGQDADHSKMLMEGRRYKDDNRVARMVVGDIYAECGYDIEAAKKKFLALTSTEIESYIVAALKDSAGADYWYEYEKQWD